MVETAQGEERERDDNYLVNQYLHSSTRTEEGEELGEELRRREERRRLNQGRKLMLHLCFRAVKTLK